MLKKTLVVALLALALPLTGVVSPAVADVTLVPISDCSSASVDEGIVDLQGAVGTVTLAGQNAEKDRAALQTKLAEAAVKIDEDKPLDAAAKLTDFRNRTIRLQDSGKIGAADAVTLITAADAIILCLGGGAQ